MKKIILTLTAATLLIAIAALTACTQEEKPSLNAGELAEAVLSAVDFPAMAEYTENSDIEQYMGIDLENVEEISCHVQLMSAQLAEVIIIIPADGKMDAVMEYLNDRLDYIKTQAAFYPGQTAAAEASLAGQENGVAYLICNENAEVAKTAFLEAIKK